MQKSIENIYSLLLAATGGESSPWCCLDSVGSVFHISDGMAKMIGVPKKSVKSLFQFNPEWSYLDWQEIQKSLSDTSSDSRRTKYLTSDGGLLDCEITITSFFLNEESIFLYQIIVEKKEEPPKHTSEQESIIQEIKPAEKDKNSNFSYDQKAPNPVIYFGDDGKIVYYNDQMKAINDLDKTGKTNVDQLFLESELGPLAPGLKTYPVQGKEIVIRMIMRSEKEMIEGFGRCSVHEGNTIAPAKYRLEFLILADMQLIDKPLEDAFADMERVKHDFDEKRDQIVAENLDDFSFENIISKSPKYKAVLRQVAQVADTNTTVLISGETGTGKELLCNAIYKLSDRSDQLMVRVNCASIPHDLIESILFGHEKGSFTGADSRKIGKFELADGGTIFLDEIGEMPLDLQPKLLRVLQEGEIERIGNPQPIKVDVRVIAATNRNLERLSKEGKFRPDLFYRLNVFPIYNIPLRERAEDIPLLINHFLEKANKKIGKNVRSLRSRDIAVLKKYHFPGNVRELENIIMRSVILSKDEEANLDFFYQSSNNESNSNNKPFFSYDELITNHLKQALELADGKVTGEDSASEMLGINGKTLASKLRKYGIDPRDFKK